ASNNIDRCLAKIKVRIAVAVGGGRPQKRKRRNPVNGRKVLACRGWSVGRDFPAIYVVAGDGRQRFTRGSLRGRGPSEIHGGLGDLKLNRRDGLRNRKHSCADFIRRGRGDRKSVV